MSLTSAPAALSGTATSGAAGREDHQELDDYQCRNVAAVWHGSGRVQTLKRWLLTRQRDV